MIYLMIENSSLGIFENYFFEVNLDLHAVVRDNKKDPIYPSVLVNVSSLNKYDTISQQGNGF